jgi:hypothetical protein
MRGRMPKAAAERSGRQCGLDKLRLPQLNTVSRDIPL